jgi:hypothetical protein
VNPADVVLIDEAILTPKRCERLRREAARLSCRFLLVTKHPVADALERSRYSFASDCLLKGLSGSDLLDAIRRRRKAASPPTAVSPSACKPASRAGGPFNR